MEGQEQKKGSAEVAVRGVGSLEKSAEILEKLFSITHVLFAYMDTRFNFIRVNRAYAEVDGHSPDYYVGKNHFALYPSKENEIIFRQVIETGKTYTAYEKPFEYADHPERGITYWDWNLLPIKGDSGEVEGLVLCLVDVSQRVRMGEALRQSEAHFRRVFDESPIGAAIVGLDYHYRRVNEQYCRITGYSAEELTSMAFMDIIHPDDLGRAVSQARALVAGEIDRYQIDQRYIHKGGRVIWIRLWVRLIKDKDGMPLYFLPLMRDITEEKKNEEELRVYRERLEELVEERTAQLAETNARLQREIIQHRKADEQLREMNKSLTDVLSSISDGFFTLDHQMTVTYFNQAAEQLVGKKTEEVIGRHLFDAFSEARGTIFERKAVYALQNKKHLSFEAYLEAHKNWYDVRIYPYKNGISVYFQVTNARKKAEAERERLRKEAQEERDRLMALLNTISDEIWFCDMQGNVTLMNVAAERPGFTPEDVSQPLPKWLPTAEIFDSEGRPRSIELAPLLRSLRGEIVRNAEEIVRIPRTGELRHREASSTPLRNSEGQIIGAVAAVRDITKRKQAEQALRDSESKYRDLAEHLEEKVKQKVSELKQAEALAAIGRMVSVVAHEVRNPLQNINMGIDILGLELGQDENKAEVLEEIKYGVGVLNGIISELLDYSKAVALQPVPVAVGVLVQRAVSMIETELGRTSVALALEQPEREISVDATKFIQVLVNLFSNAADAMPDGGTITVRSSFAECGGAEVLHLSVSDSGHGIDEQHLHLIFEPFFTTKTRGTGLGLSVCKRIIEAHAGSLRITSKPGEGTTAEITIPVSR